MTLFDKNGNRYTFTKTTQPKFNYSWDSKFVKIDGEQKEFFFKYTGYFYVFKVGNWYKTPYDGENQLPFDNIPELFSRGIKQ